MEVIIHSWNAQGSFRRKSSYLEGLLSNNKPNILLIQEEGTIGETKNKNTGFETGDEFEIGGHTFQCIVAQRDPGALVSRCTTAIMLENSLIRHKTDQNTYQREVARPLCYVLFGDICIATLHAIANDSDSVTEVKNHLKYLSGCMEDKDERIRDWILMGDFNSWPYRYDMDIKNHALRPEALVTYNKAYPICYEELSNYGRYCNIMIHGDPTQGPCGRRENYLDYIFFSMLPAFHIINIYNRMVKDKEGNHISDHNLISLWVNLLLNLNTNS